jgi:hypothetical protein
MFETSLVFTKFGLIEIRKIIASWHNQGGTTGPSYKKSMKLFNEWLITLGIDEDSRRAIRNIANSGKRELEESARRYIDEHWCE